MVRLFDFYRSRIPTTGYYDDAAGASVAPIPAAAYRVVLLAHLPGNVNRGNHVAFVDVLGADGLPISNPPLRIGWTWQGRRADEPAPPVALDKPSTDMASGNLPINAGQVLSLWLQAGTAQVSDMAVGLQTATPDDDPATGNYRYHNSFYVIFRQAAAIPVPPPAPPPTGDMAACMAQVAVLQGRVDAMVTLVGSWGARG